MQDAKTTIESLLLNGEVGERKGAIDQQRTTVLIQPGRQTDGSHRIWRKGVVLLSGLAINAMATCTAHAGSYEWTSSYTQGVEEHLVDDGNGNQLDIACPDDNESAVSAYATIAGKQYSSENDGFDVIVDGTTFSNPFYTDCEACSSNFPGFWAALRKARTLQLSAGGQTVRLPTQNLPQVLQPLTSKKNLCRSAW